MKSNINIGLFIMRVSLGVLMLMHGISKVKSGIQFIQSSFADIGLPAFMSYAVYLGEIIAPLMLIVGFRTKIAAFFIAITMAVVIFLVNVDQIGAITNVGAWAMETPGLFLFGSLALMFTGSGKYALSSSNKWD